VFFPWRFRFSKLIIAINAPGSEPWEFYYEPQNSGNHLTVMLAAIAGLAASQLKPPESRQTGLW
jgi:hypothetical protein